MDKPIGSETLVKVEVKEGKVVLSAVYDGKGADASVSLAVDGEYLIDKLAEKIPGDTVVEKITLEALKMSLRSLKV